MLKTISTPYSLYNSLYYPTHKPKNNYNFKNYKEYSQYNY